jgi:beta-glucanase (GH16 family)
MDDTLYFTYRNEGTGTDAWPFDTPFYLILNIAVGGEWGGAEGVDSDVFPQQLVVDHVRVYEVK